jgi:antitoxin component YwqK of YwqJK toxin-antitoxin module
MKSFIRPLILLVTVFSFLFIVVILVRFHDSQYSVTKYDSNGKKLSSFEFHLKKNRSTGQMDTILSGISTKWNPDGHVTSSETYRDGKLDGKSRDFFKNGTERGIFYYSSGKLDSSVYRNQKGRIVERFHSGPEKDTIFRYDDSGNVTVQIGLVTQD